MSSKTLVIAEKPSVAGDLAKVLPGKFEKTKTHYEGDEYIISYAIGHLVTICHPEEINENYKPWKLDNLPILPDHFPLKGIDNTKTQLNALKKLLKRKDVDTIINACDAGREGELIFKYIMDFASSPSTAKKSVKRLWLQSMTKDAIKSGFASLKDGAEMEDLAQAAQCRSESDWLIGINASRALTAYKSKWGGFFLTPCGRVQTPTLSLLVKRENERKIFTPTPYWEVHATFAQAPGNYDGRWIAPDFKKTDEQPHGRQDRIWDAPTAEDIKAKCEGKPAEVTETQKPSSQAAPALYDLTSLQRDANGRFGFSARNTLSIAQALYERHKVLTYPRTDSRHLPEDYVESTKELMGSLSGGELGKFASEALDKGYVKPNKKIFDNKKISDHHAIIPTLAIPKDLSEPEAKIYKLVVQRFLAIFFPSAQYLNTKRLSIVEGETFLTEGKVLENPGWRAIYGVSADEDATLAPLAEDGKVTCKELDVNKDETKPPPRFSEATLLGAMEHSDRYVDDDSLKDALKEHGLGTPATRASIIEGLISDKYVVREAKELIPTGKAFELMGLVDAMHIEALRSPELTGEWEYKLAQVTRGEFSREEFMKGIRDLTADVIAKVKGFDEDKETKRDANFGPINDKTFFETLSRWESNDGEIMIRKILGGREMKESEVVELLEKGEIGPLEGFRSKKGKPFVASLKINKQNKVEFVFASNATFDDEEKAKILAQEPLGVSPLDGTKVFDTSAAYMSESALEDDREKGLRINKVILGKTLEPKHVQQLLTDGKTELIPGFRSQRTRRLFDAFLTLNKKKGDVKFEFPPREAGYKKKAKKSAE